MMRRNQSGSRIVLVFFGVTCSVSKSSLSSLVEVDYTSLVMLKVPINTCEKANS